jgi:acyl carrier protein
VSEPGPQTLGSVVMAELTREQIRDLMGAVLTAQGKTLPADDDADLREIGFRSLDFSELALRVEDEIGDELNFDAPGLRQIAKVGDVLDFIEQLQSA